MVSSVNKRQKLGKNEKARERKHEDGKRQKQQ